MPKLTEDLPHSQCAAILLGLATVRDLFNPLTSRKWGVGGPYLKVVV